MGELIDFTTVLGNNEGATGLSQIVSSIMEIPDDAMSEDMIESIVGAVKGSLTDKIRTETIQSIVDSFEDSGFTRAEAQQMYTDMVNNINEVIDTLKPSELKKKLINRVMEIVLGGIKEAVSKYHSYSIHLPMYLEDGAKVPTYAHDTDAAADLYAADTMTLPARSQGNMVRTGVHIGLPEGWMALIIPRSSIGAKTGLRLSNSVGLIDTDYRGPLGVLYDNISDSDYTINVGDRIAQLLVMPVHRFSAEVMDNLSETDRGEGGFGSSGK